MKKGLLLVLLVGLMTSCSSNENTQLIGKWRLTEVLADPGDGSGTFQRVDSEKTIEFFNDGTLVINISLCDNDINNNTESSGTYSIEQSIISVDCEDTEFQIRFNLQNSKLIMNYPFCVEPCKEKYTKIE